METDASDSAERGQGQLWHIAGSRNRSGDSFKNAQISLETAQDVYKWPELEVAEADVDEAEANLQYALDRAAEQGGSWDAAVQRFQPILEAAEGRLEAMLIGASPDEVEVQSLLVAAAQIT